MPEAERWWDLALDGAEEQRKANLVDLDRIKHGMHTVRETM